MRSIHDPRYQDLIKRLIELRESKNVTQVELARRLNKPQSYVSKIEILERRIDVIELIDWLEVMNTNVKDFLNFYDF
ncbi:helix-turn-helix domain-containing protein [Acinetobacter baumannii]|uniref:helix-turn-helix domain-containing protein n=1 Tax=Acinetobacter baumannii TaxID=470 RepID=UPI000BF873F0|nr:helix-turn-helix transcriptional regulator [Acinetobacter baumannii]MDO7430962.1 helix-turn-helix transcriptional regulator [Acinetobacter baumannii]TPT46450.1 helix-turn-helix transcriptional regulator [Acinetobacter baumannii]HDU8433419.1 helix-turn-helix transcriptional regulator [Acinetobacter baumannii]